MTNPYAKIYSDQLCPLIVQKKLGFNEISVYLMIRAYEFGDERRCWLSANTLSEKCNIPVERVYDAIRSLINKGFLERKKMKDRYGNVRSGFHVLI